VNTRRPRQQMGRRRLDKIARRQLRRCIHEQRPALSASGTIRISSLRIQKLVSSSFRCTSDGLHRRNQQNDRRFLPSDRIGAIGQQHSPCGVHTNVNVGISPRDAEANNQSERDQYGGFHHGSSSKKEFQTLARSFVDTIGIRAQKACASLQKNGRAGPGMGTSWINWIYHRMVLKRMEQCWRAGLGLCVAEVAFSGTGPAPFLTKRFISHSISSPHSSPSLRLQVRLSIALRLSSTRTRKRFEGGQQESRRAKARCGLWAESDFARKPHDSMKTHHISPRSVGSVAADKLGEKGSVTLNRGARTRWRTGQERVRLLQYRYGYQGGRLSVFSVLCARSLPPVTTAPRAADSSALHRIGRIVWLHSVWTAAKGGRYPVWNRAC